MGKTSTRARTGGVDMDKIIVNFGGVLLAPCRIRKEASVRFISLSPQTSFNERRSEVGLIGTEVVLRG